MRVAIEGCCHGELDRIYASLNHLQRVENITIDLLLVCGDFQCVRNTADLGTLACPDKYRSVGNFYQYYTGQKKAPIPTIFIGGNHEASSYLWELYHGGWVAPNIYFLGFAGVINVSGLRIAGLSGIYKKHDYDAGYYETQPFNDSHSRSIYHVRKFNVFRLAQISKPLDIIMSHDWPRGIAFHGNTRALLQMKPFLGGEINTNTLGSYPNEFLLKRLRPTYWFAAHLHVKFAAIYRHDTAEYSLRPEHGAGLIASPSVENPDEIDIGSDVEDGYGGHNEVSNGDTDQEPESISGEPIVEWLNVPNIRSTAVDLSPRNCVSIDDRLIASDELLPMDPADKVDTGTDKTVTTVLPLAAMNTLPVPKLAQSLEDERSLVEDTGGDYGTSGEEVGAHDKKHASYTKFLALDKCLPGRDFLQILDIPGSSGPAEFFYDEEWLAIFRATYDLFTFSKDQKKVPEDAEMKRRISEELHWVKENVSSMPDGLKIPHNFNMTAPAYNTRHQPANGERIGDGSYLNPQTVQLCDLLGLKNLINPDGVKPVAITGTAVEEQPVDPEEQYGTTDSGINSQPGDFDKHAADERVHPVGNNPADEKEIETEIVHQTSGPQDIPPHDASEGGELIEQGGAAEFFIDRQGSKRPELGELGD